MSNSYISSDVRLEFRLYDPNRSYSSEEFISIREPIKMDAVEVVLKRDNDFFGVNYEYSTDELQIQFGGESDGIPTGVDLIRAVYDAQGVDGDVIFEIYDNQEDQIVFQGNIQFKDIKISTKDGTIEARIRRLSFEDTFRSRIDAEVDITATEDLDGNTISGISSETIHVKAPTHQKFLDLVIDADQQTEGNNWSSDNRVGIFLPFYKKNKDSVGWFNYPSQEDDEDYLWIKSNTKGNLQNLDPEDDGGTSDYNRYINYQMYSFKQDIEGEFWIGDLEYYWDGDFQFTASTGAITEIQIRFMLIVMNGSRLIREEEIFHVEQTGLSATVHVEAVTASATISDLSLMYNDEVYICAITRASRSFGAVKTSMQCDTSSQNATITYSPTVYKISQPITGYSLENAFNKAIEIITGKSSTLTGSFFSSGMAKNNHFTNGNLIKLTTGKPVNVSVKDLLDAMYFLFWAGFQIEGNDEGESVRVTHAADFFTDKEIMVIDSVSDFEIVPADDMMYNEIELQFKTKEGTVGSEVDAHVKANYINELKTVKRKYLPKHSMNMSAPLILQAIEERDAKNQDEVSQENDQDAFLFSTTTVSSITPDSVIGESLFDILIFDGIHDVFNAISSFTIPSGTYSGTHTIDSVSFGRTGSALKTYVRVTTNITTTSTQASPTVNFTSVTISETNEPFSAVESGYESHPNLRHNLKAILYNHSPLLSASLDRKTGTSIRNLKLQKDSEFSCTFSANEDYSTIGGTSFDYDQSESQSNIEANKLFIPEWITFKTRMNWSEFNRLKEALRNESDEDINFGYVSVFNPENNQLYKIAIWEAKKNPISEMVSIKGLRRIE